MSPRKGRQIGKRREPGTEGWVTLTFKSLVEDKKTRENEGCPLK